MDIYDVIIIGGGPAGLTAGLYAGRARLKTLVVEKKTYGGQIVVTHDIENYPGGVENESGSTLIDRMVGQTEKFEVEKTLDTIRGVELDGDIKILKGKDAEYKTRSLVIATGATPHPIGCKGEKELAGKGISYCATCDASIYEDFEVFVVGGGDAAVEEALYLARFARKVTIIHRRNELRAAKSIQEKAFANEKIEFMWDSVVDEIHGDGLVEAMTVRNKKTGEIKKIEAHEDDGTFGIFVFIGLIPQSDLFEGIVHMENGYIVTDDEMRTNIKGVFAAGDIRKKSLRQVVTAAADGAIAAIQAEKYIETLD